MKIQVSNSSTTLKLTPYICTYMNNTPFLMLKFIIRFILIVLCCSCSKSSQEPLTIATASNMKVAMVAIQKAFEEKTGIRTQLVVASSGKLTAQIEAGAPFDIFVSADMKYPTTLFNKGFTKNKPHIYAFGTLILWTYKDNIEPSLEILTSKSIKYIALANPKTAPYGRAAEEVIEFYSLKKDISAGLVFGESISQTNQFIQTKNVGIGFTSKSIIYSPHLKNKGKWIEIPREAYNPIVQGVIQLNTNKNSSEFYDFLCSQTAKTILKDHGYLIN